MKIRARVIGISLVLLTYSLVFLIASTIYETYLDILSPSTILGKFWYGVYFLFSILCILSNFCCMITNPGTLHEKIFPQWPSCDKCGLKKIEKVHHCSRCNLCVYKMDHHCYWVNTCVGYYNQKLYILFLIYTALFCGISAVLIITERIFCEIVPDSLHCTYQHESLLLEYQKIISFLVSVFFFAFVIYLLFDQYENISSDLSQIDRLQNFQNKAKESFKKNLESVFGGSLSVLWLIPISKAKPIEEVFKLKKN